MSANIVYAILVTSLATFLSRFLKNISTIININKNSEPLPDYPATK